MEGNAKDNLFYEDVVVLLLTFSFFLDFLLLVMRLWDAQRLSAILSCHSTAPFESDIFPLLGTGVLGIIIFGTIA